MNENLLKTKSSRKKAVNRKSKVFTGNYLQNSFEIIIMLSLDNSTRIIQVISK